MVSGKKEKEKEKEKRSKAISSGRRGSFRHGAITKTGGGTVGKGKGKKGSSRGGWSSVDDLSSDPLPDGEEIGSEIIDLSSLSLPGSRSPPSSSPSTHPLEPVSSSSPSSPANRVMNGSSPLVRRLPSSSSSTSSPSVIAQGLPPACQIPRSSFRALSPPSTLFTQWEDHWTGFLFCFVFVLFLFCFCFVVVVLLLCFSVFILLSCF